RAAVSAGGRARVDDERPEEARERLTPVPVHVDPVREPVVMIAALELPVADRKLRPTLSRLTNLVVDVRPARLTLAKRDPHNLVDTRVDERAHDAIDTGREPARRVVVANVDHGDLPQRRAEVSDRIERARRPLAVVHTSFGDESPARSDVDSQVDAPAELIARTALPEEDAANRVSDKRHPRHGRHGRA